MKFLLLLMLICPMAFAAPVYKCPTQAGKVLYQDTPCQGGTVVPIGEVYTSPSYAPPLVYYAPSYEPQRVPYRYPHRRHHAPQYSIYGERLNTAPGCIGCKPPPPPPPPTIIVIQP